jgi:DNA-binding response OmpR family regulator
MANVDGLAPGNGGTVRVLIADDDATTRQLLELALRSWGYDPVLVPDGARAWDLLQRADAPRLCLVDRQMPGVDGITLCRRIRERDPQRRSYVLLVTVKDARGDIADGFAAGADDYVTKPFDRDELQVRVRLGSRVVELQQKLLGGAG